MPDLVLLLSGPIASGKSTLAKSLVERHQFRAIRSGQYLQAMAVARGIQINRLALQELGDGLDEATDFGWIVQDVAGPLIASDEEQSRWLMDSVRKERQVEHFRNRFGRKVLHVHLSPPDDQLRARYELRRLTPDSFEIYTTYEDAIAHQNENSSRSLGPIADLNLGGLSAEVILELVLGGIASKMKGC